MPLAALLFDIDGTLADSNELHVDVWDQVFRAHELSVSREAIHSQVGKGADKLVPALVPDADAETVKALGEEHGAIFKREHLAEVRPFPKAHELLRRAHEAGVRVVLASSASRDEVEHYLDLLEARDLVDATTTADDVGASKPAPDIFSLALERAGTPADQTLAVGDSPYDAEAAGKCGVAAIGFRSGGFSDETLLGAGVKRLYDDAAAMLADFDQVLRGEL